MTNLFTRNAEVRHRSAKRGDAMKFPTLRRHAAIALYAAGFFAMIIAGLGALIGALVLAGLALRWLGTTFPVATGATFIAVLGVLALCFVGSLVWGAWVVAKDWYEFREEERRAVR